MKLIAESHKALDEKIQEIAEVAEYLWQRGWAEKNAGNISVNVTEELDGFNGIKEPLVMKLDQPYPSLINQYLLITGKGTRMRDLPKRIYKTMLLLRICEDASSYEIHAHRSIDENILLLPTSELLVHLATHEMLINSGSPNKVAMHAHIEEVIALTQHPEFCNIKNINEMMLNLNPEIDYFIPRKLGFVPFYQPGSEKTAKAAIRVMSRHDVAIWEKHGVFSCGPDIYEAFELIDIVAKIIRAYFLCKSSSVPIYGLTYEQMRKMALQDPED